MQRPKGLKKPKPLNRLLAKTRQLKYLNLVGVAMLTLILLSPASAAGIETDYVRIDDISSGELVFYTDVPGQFLPATKLSTEVDMKISGMVSRVSLRQSFVNTGNDWTEALYVFPLAEDAAVDSLKMIIGERVIIGDIQEKQEAREAYEAAKDAGYQASLLEQKRPNMFMTSVANIAPGQTIIIEISYIETLTLKDNSFSMRFPLAITPRYSPGPKIIGEENVNYQNTKNGWAVDTGEETSTSTTEAPYSYAITNPVTMHIELDAGFELENIESSYHAVSIVKNENHYTIDLDDANSDRDFELVWQPKLGNTPAAAVFKEQIGLDNYALVMIMPPKLENLSQNISRELIFIIDTSGSMSGASIEQAKNALILALDRLKTNDYFNIVEFNSYASELFNQPQIASSRNLARAKSFVRSLRADGGTEMISALNLALKNRTPAGLLRQVVFITDGSVDNETELFRLIERKLQDANLFTVAIGSAPNSYFMRKAAEFGRGSFVYISDIAEVKEKMEKLFIKLENPVMTNIALSLPNGTEFYPKVVPNLYVAEPVILTMKLPGLNGEVSISGQVANTRWTRSVNLSAAANGEVAQLWARAKVESLNDDMVRGGDYKQIEKEITVLALKHHLITDYTSLVAVDNNPARPNVEGLATEVLPLEIPMGQIAQEGAYQNKARSLSVQPPTAAMGATGAAGPVGPVGVKGSPSPVSTTADASSSKIDTETEAGNNMTEIVDFEIDFVGLHYCKKNNGYLAAMIAITNTGTIDLGTKTMQIIDLNKNENLYGPYSNSNYDENPKQCAAGLYDRLDAGKTLFSSYFIIDGIKADSIYGDSIKIVVKICPLNSSLPCVEKEITITLPEDFSF